jgi:hypothetical protein
MSEENKMRTVLHFGADQDHNRVVRHYASYEELAYAIKNGQVLEFNFTDNGVERNLWINMAKVTYFHPAP